MRDLSIRGAGDLLGSEQAGFVDTVGIEMYMQMIEEEMRRMKGEEIPDEEDEHPNKSLVEVETHISDSYVSDEDIKIEIHQKINEIDGYEKLQEVKKELEDRFGRISKEIEIYMYEEWFEKIAKDLDIIKVNQTKTTVEIIFSANKSNEIDGEKLFMNAYDISRYFRFSYKNRCLSITLEIVRLEKHYIYYLIDLLKTML